MRKIYSSKEEMEQEFDLTDDDDFDDSDLKGNLKVKKYF